MRAFAADKFGPISQLTLREIPTPVPAPGELLVRVRAAAVNPADLKVLNHRTGGSFLHASKFPLIVGYDFSGVVESFGAAVSGFAAGDEVFGFLPYARGTRGGSFAEYLTVSAGGVGKKPKSVSHEEAAACATSAATALQGLRKGRIAAGKTVLVNGGSGGVGSYAVQMARELGARVSATASSKKSDYVKGLGAEAVFDYRAAPVAGLKEKFDLLFDVMSNLSYGNCAHLINAGGAFITLLPSPSVFLGIARTAFSSTRCAFIICQPAPADFAQIATWFDEGKLKPVLERSYPFEELPIALERQEKGEIVGKLAITVAAK